MSTQKSPGRGERGLVPAVGKMIGRGPLQQAEVPWRLRRKSRFTTVMNDGRKQKGGVERKNQRQFLSFSDVIHKERTEETF